jgi:hypothetical protein
MIATAPKDHAGVFAPLELLELFAALDWFRRFPAMRNSRR